MTKKEKKEISGYHDVAVCIRFRVEELEAIDDFLSHKKNEYKYSNRSHFIRCAIMRLIKKEGL